MLQILISPSGGKPYFSSALSSCRTKPAHPKTHCPTSMDQNHTHPTTPPPHQPPTTRPHHMLARSPSTPIPMPLTFETHGKRQHRHKLCKPSKNTVFQMPLFLRWSIPYRMERMETRTDPIQISRKKACGKHIGSRRAVVIIFDGIADRLLHTHLIKCRGKLTVEQRGVLKSWMDNELKSAGSEKALTDRWSLDLDELRALANVART